MLGLLVAILNVYSCSHDCKCFCGSHLLECHWMARVLDELVIQCHSWAVHSIVIGVSVLATGEECLMSCSYNGFRIDCSYIGC